MGGQAEGRNHDGNGSGLYGLWRNLRFCLCHHSCHWPDCPAGAAKAGAEPGSGGGSHCHGRLLRPDDSSQHGTGCIREPEQCVYLQAVYGRDSAGIIHWLLFPGILPYLRQKA